MLCSSLTDAKPSDFANVADADEVVDCGQVVFGLNDLSSRRMADVKEMARQFILCDISSLPFLIVQ